MSTPAITAFSGPYRFLSNFYPCYVIYEDVRYRSVEHAYQAAKTLDLFQRTTIEQASTAGIAKARGRTVTLRPDWEDVKIAIMRDLLRQKFDRPDLAAALLVTGDADLVEGNHWHDTFWGVCCGVGENWLGKILMERREALLHP